MASAYEDDILRSLRRIVRAIDLHSRRLVSQHGLTTPQLVCLRAMRHQSMSPSELAKEVELSQATITGITDRLVGRGFIERSRDATDRRRVLLTITKSGSKVADSAPSPLQEHFAARLSKLPDENQLIIKTTLEQIVKMMDATEVDAAPFLTPEDSLAGNNHKSKK